MKQMTEEQKTALRQGLTLVIGALLGWLISCNTTFNIQKHNINTEQKATQTSKATNKQDSTALKINLNK